MRALIKLVLLNLVLVKLAASSDDNKTFDISVAQYLTISGNI